MDQAVLILPGAPVTLAKVCLQTKAAFLESPVPSFPGWDPSFPQELEALHR